MTVSGPALRPRTFRDLSDLLYKWAGIRIQGKEEMVEGRLRPRLRKLDLGYTQYLERIVSAGPESADAIDFINALTTNKTSFFREPHHFDFLRDVLFAALEQQANRGGGRAVRLWSAACSSGEEPYTLAMIANHYLPASRGWDVRILATDIDTGMLERARTAVYDKAAVAGVPKLYAAGSFEDPDHQGNARLRPEVARLIQFSRANLISVPFPVKGKFHAVLCRNVMIYFDRDTQQRVVDNLSRCLRPDGYLIVGHSESLIAQHLRRVPEGIGVYQVEGSTAEASPPVASPARVVAPPPRRVAPRPVAIAVPVLPQVQVRRPVAAGEEGASQARRSITVGEVAASAEPLRITTLLGSCVAACLFDPVAGIGGMNHFLLPSSDGRESMPGRFGVHAMELLINRLMRLGAERDRLVAKVFGAARVSQQTLIPVAEKNAEFIREFLKKESIPLLVERLGGTSAREITLDCKTGRVEVRVVASHARLANEELDAAESTAPNAKPFDVDAALF